jgi:hypothetical protein
MLENWAGFKHLEVIPNRIRATTSILMGDRDAKISAAIEEIFIYADRTER